MPSVRYDGEVPEGEALVEQIAPFGLKFFWFLDKGYKPHIYQQLFHSFGNDGKLCRFRHLVAGRRGGKTLSAAWELLFYSLFPEYFHHDAHGTESSRPLWAWVLTKDHVMGRPALLTFRDVLKQAGLSHGIEYKEHRGNRYFEFENGSLVEFKTADDPQSLRGAGLDFLWMDEAAMIPTSEAWDVTYPALADKSGIVVSTTTPRGKNWFYDEWWNEQSVADPDVARVEYRTIDNPFLPKEVWETYRRTYHPMLFEQEFMASFDSMAGRELSGEWLHYYNDEDIKGKALEYYIGVDPAISLLETADNFAMALIGLDRKEGIAYLIELFKGKLPFPEQVNLINEWYQTKYPRVIGVESNAYQAALGQQVTRIQSLAPIAAIRATGRKVDRILSMAPLFKLKKVLIREDQRDFIQEWVDYDPTVKNPKDDCLDAVEIALRVAGAILPTAPPVAINKPKDTTASSFEEIAREDRAKGVKKRIVDTHFGEYW
jgi:predicted phage terminase large subunit-like protein